MTSLLSHFELERLAHPERSDKESVRAIAAGLIAELGITEPPIRVEMVASYLDVRSIDTVPGLDAAGCLVCDGQAARIQVRASDGLTRKRFTVCHECGHIFFPGYSLQPRYRCEPGTRTTSLPRLEALCDTAAADLLLPPALLRPLVRREGLTLESVDAFASQFEASFVATATQSVRWSPVPTAVLVLEPDRSPSGEILADSPLRLRSFSRRGQWPYFKVKSPVLEDDVFDRARRGELVFEPAAPVGSVLSREIECEVTAELRPYGVGAAQCPRVVAILRRPGEVLDG